MCAALISYLVRRRPRETWPAIALPVIALVSVAAFRYALFGAMASGEAAMMKGFAEQCMAEYDIDGWTAPDLINPGDFSFHAK